MRSGARRQYRLTTFFVLVVMRFRDGTEIKHLSAVTHIFKNIGQIRIA